MNLKNDLKLAFSPKSFSNLAQTFDFKSGLKIMLIWSLLLVVFNVAFSLINGAINGKLLGKLFGFSLFISLAVLIVMVLSLVIVGVIGGWLSKLIFKGEGNISKSIGAISYGIVPMFLIGVIQNLILFIDALGANFSNTAFNWMYLILMIISLVWVAWISMEALAWANAIKKTAGFVCFIVGFIVVSLLNLFIVGWLVSLLVEIFKGIGVF
ncbi:YIP1 family protein [Nanoarchaeota archaeon]